MKSRLDAVEDRCGRNLYPSLAETEELCRLVRQLGEALMEHAWDLSGGPLHGPEFGRRFHDTAAALDTYKEWTDG